ncbi:alpha/beta fold hydrolase [Actinomadura sp. 9N407]|uniref:alpha/beta fold hydrolase n=1 Tax=Actinomadura sp. 9N407 TaxID=3375154 RepID=UPI0037B74057
MKYGYADSPLGQLHYVEAGQGEPIILLHQTPRSLDEFAELVPLLAPSRRVIAMDMYGFGMSAKPDPSEPQTIEMYATGVLALVDALQLENFAVLGHHTGFFVASEVASRAPERVTAAVLSAGEYMDAATRAAESEPKVDTATTQEDGSHLVQLWQDRYPAYPVGRPDILNRFIRDALAPGLDPKNGHLACSRYMMEERVGLVTCPILIVAATEDPVSYPHTERLQNGYPNAKSVQVSEIVGGHVPLIEERAEDVAQAVLAFLAGVVA